jgi:hypothetical protein
MLWATRDRRAEAAAGPGGAARGVGGKLKERGLAHAGVVFSDFANDTGMIRMFFVEQ